MVTWFLFDLGNTLIKLGYERVLEKQGWGAWPVCSRKLGLN